MTHQDDPLPQDHQGPAVGRLRLQLPLQEPVCVLGQRRCQGDGGEGYRRPQHVYSQLGPRVERCVSMRRACSVAKLFPCIPFRHAKSSLGVPRIHGSVNCGSSVVCCLFSAPLLHVDVMLFLQGSDSHHGMFSVLFSSAYLA